MGGGGGRSSGRYQIVLGEGKEWLAPVFGRAALSRDQDEGDRKQVTQSNGGREGRIQQTGR